MRTLYLECKMGAAGDMLMSALLELLNDREAFLAQINEIGLEGVSIEAFPVKKCGIIGTQISVKIGEQKENENDNIYSKTEIKHSHDNHTHKNLKGINEILSELRISKKVRNNALEVYRLLAEAEAEVHGCPVTDIHFHEVGNLDAIADIVGVCLLIDILAPERIIASPINTGSGFVKCAHGVLPVPAPATAQLLKDVPIYSSGEKSELCTPTGAALIKHFADAFGEMPLLRIEKTGYGMGSKDFEKANCVRVFFGETEEKSACINNKVAELRCNIDDMTGESLGFTCRALMKHGALDVYTTAVGMKKDRPAFLLTCICEVNQAEEFAAFILKHTSTFGVRKAILERYTLEREIRTKETPYGAVEIKTGRGYGIVKTKIEYESIARLAEENEISFDEMKQKIQDFLKSGEI